MENNKTMKIKPNHKKIKSGEPNLYQAIIQQSPFGFAQLKVNFDEHKKIEDLVFIAVNKSFEKMTGLNSEVVIGKMVSEVFPEIISTKDKWTKIIATIMKEGMKEFNQYLGATHSWHHFEMYSPLKNYIVIQFHDVSAELNQLVQYENFFKVNLDLLSISEVTGNFLKVNKEWEYVLGYSTNELEHMNFLDFVHPEDLNATLEAMSALSKDQEIINFINRFRRKDGSYRYIEWRSHPHGELIYGAARDITNRIELERKLQEKNTLIESILDNAPVGIWITYPSEDEASFFSNKYVEENFAITEEENIKCKITDQDALSRDYPQHYEENITFKDGKKHILETVKTKIFREDGSILGTLGFGLDITDRKEGEEALRLSETKYRLLTETSSDVIWVMNLKTYRLTYVSPTIQTLRGYSVDETMEQSIQDIISMESFDLVKESISKALKDFVKNPNSANSVIIEALLSCKNGKYIWSEISARLRYNDNHEIEVVGVSRNIEKRKKFEREVLYLSYHDQLTGLFNRRFYEEELKRISEENNFPISLVMSDVNGLKLTNDAFGHVLGDKLLIAYAEILKKECRAGDIIARIGGDEFVLLLPRTNALQAEKIVERIHAIVSNTMIEKIMLSVSFGWKTKYTEEEEFDEIYKQAEDAMYRRKLLEGKSYKSDTIKLITKSLYEKSPREQIHSERVSMLCKHIGVAMGMSPDDVNELGLVGLLHDIGKIAIDEQILNKSSKLTEEEWEEMKRHPEIGYHILRSVNEFADIAEYVLAHHERVDGRGYPKGLFGEDIPLKSKILFVAEAFDEMTGSYKYKKALSVPEAVSELRKNSGIQFDNKTVGIFVEQVLNEE